MAQRPALSLIAVDSADELADAFAEAAADEVITIEEIAYLMPLVRMVQVNTQRVDLAQAAGLALIRGGETAQRAKGLLRDVSAFMPIEPEAA